MCVWMLTDSYSVYNEAAVSHGSRVAKRVVRSGNDFSSENSDQSTTAGAGYSFTS